LTKVAKIPLFENIFSDDGRSLNADALNQLGVFAADAIHRLQVSTL
jgi:hypothetical protein